ncbi:tripartite motif-containing protein 2-like [Ptychodera flava]|uniref:tripartite motif-containing protein 2-like n=1 Tax=Ptychodera flava TaxID=63121 RepID=UPI003969D91A
MAEKHSTFLEEMDGNFLSCVICLERYKNAKLLQCLHSFCELCLDKLAVEGKTITCPICRRPHQLPDSGVTGIGDNSFINEQVEIVRKREASSADARMCEGCAQAESVKHCLECGVNLCNICATAHSRLRILRSHHLMTLKEYEAAKSDDPALVQPPVYCTSHSDDQVEFYCDTCNLVICYKCAALDHPITEHQYKRLKDAAAEYSKDLKEEIDKVKVKEIEASDSKAVVMETVKSLENCYQAEEVKIKLHIQKTIDDVTRMIRENGDKLLQELKDEYNKRKVNLNAQLKELECLESDMSYAREYAEKLTHYGNAAQLMSAKKGISSQMEELLRVETKLDPTETDYMEFKPSDDLCQAKTLGVLYSSDLADRCTLENVPEYVRVNENISITLDVATLQKVHKQCEFEVGAVLMKPDKSQETVTATDNGDGRWSLKTVAKMVGNHETTVFVSKKPIPGSPVTIKVIPQKGLPFVNLARKGQVMESWMSLGVSW